jgi:hypothetical protein
MTDVASALRDLVPTLGNRGWYVFGAQAINAQVRPRQTNDLDVTVMCDVMETAELARAVLAGPFDPANIPNERAEEFIRMTHMLAIKHRPTGLKVDVVCGMTGFEADVCARAVTLSIDGFPVRFARVEDLVVMKVIADRSRDQIDVIDAIRVLGTKLDLGAVRERLASLDAAMDRSDLVARLDAIVADLRRSKPR